MRGSEREADRESGEWRRMGRGSGRSNCAEANELVSRVNALTHCSRVGVNGSSKELAMP